jgi:hypothetical protein
MSSVGRPGKTWSVGFEAQVQLQGEEAYRQRQERYAASGIGRSGLLPMSLLPCRATGIDQTNTYQRSRPVSGGTRRGGLVLTCMSMD